MRRRKFGLVVRMLESYAQNYRGSFEYYLALGTSCLYIDDDGKAARYYDAARRLRINNSELLLGQAALFLRHGDNTNALDYYLQVQSIDPNNRVAKDAIEFMRTNGRNYEELQRIKSNGKIRKYYPRVGVNPDIIRNFVLLGIVAVLVLWAVVANRPRQGVKWNGERGDLSGIAITANEKKNALSGELSANSVHFIMDNEMVVKSYEDAAMYWQSGRDNPCRVEINRILNSNASASFKVKASKLQMFLKELTFDTLPESDNYSYAKVENDPVLYNGCYVAWKGKIANPEECADGSWKCVLFVGYHKGIHVDGTVDVVFRPERRSPVNPEKPIEILGVVTVKNGKISLDGCGVHPLKDNAD